MQYREVGTTGIRISASGFGSGGTAGLMVRGDPEEQRAVVAKALEYGINYFDASPDYGDGQAEINLGRVFRELGVRPYLTTKVEIRNADLDDIAGAVVRSVENSLKRLGMDQVDFIQVHNGPVVERPKLEGRVYRSLWIEDYLKPGGALEGLERVQRAGMTRHIGFVCRGNDSGPAQRLINTGRFQLINLSYHLLNPTAGNVPPRGLHVDGDYGQIVQYAAAHGVGTAVYSPLASGVLTDTAVSGGDRHRLAGGFRDEGSREYRAMVDRARALSFLAKPGGPSMSQAAIRFILMNPGITTVLGGFSAMEHLEEMNGAVTGDVLSEEDVARIEMVWRGNFGQSGVAEPASQSA